MGTIICVSDFDASSRMWLALHRQAPSATAHGDTAMIDLGVAFTWIAISAAGAKGLAVFARAAATPDLEADLAPLVAEGGPGLDGYPTEALAHPRSLRP
jgi:hypothetical protein